MPLSRSESGFRHRSDGDFAPQNQPQFRKKGSFRQVKAMVINMKNFGKKTRFSLLIYSELIAGILCYVLVAAVTGLLIWSAINSEERIDDIVTVIIILAVFYLLCAVGGGWLISRFIKWKKLPDDLISADGEYLYIFTNKQIKIALNEIDSIFAGPESFLIQLFGGGYGIVEIKAVGKKYKVYFVDEANTVPDIVMNHINNL